MRGLMQMQMHRQVELIGQHANALEASIRDCVWRVRSECGAKQRLALELVMDAKALVEIFIAGLRPRGRELDDRQADHRAEAQPPVGGRLNIREKVTFVAAGGAAAQHLRYRKLDAIAHELRPHEFSFSRPNVLVQPAHQWQVVGQTTHQGHRVVRVRVHEAGDQHMLGQLDALVRRETRLCLGDRKHGDDAAVIDRNGMVFEHDSVRLYRNEPACFDEKFDGLQ